MQMHVQNLARTHYFCPNERFYNLAQAYIQGISKHQRILQRDILTFLKSRGCFENIYPEPPRGEELLREPGFPSSRAQTRDKSLHKMSFTS